MIHLQYFNGKEWSTVSSWGNEMIAWATLGGDDMNYRTINEAGLVLTDKSYKPKVIKTAGLTANEAVEFSNQLKEIPNGNRIILAKHEPGGVENIREAYNVHCTKKV